MNKEIKITIIAFLALLLFPPFALANESFPSFPMAFYGTAKLNGENLPAGTKMQAFNQENVLMGEVTTIESGIYGYDSPTKIKLVVSEYQSGGLTFKYVPSGSQTSLSGDNPIIYNDGFVSGKTVLLDLNFTKVISTPASAPPPSGGGGGGGGDTSAPTISGITATAGNTTATIAWTTNEASLSWVVYGLTTVYGSEQKTTTYATSHSVTLAGLSTNTTYHYQVKSKDSTGNVGSYTDKTFATSETSKEVGAGQPQVLGATTYNFSLDLTLAKLKDSPDVYAISSQTKRKIRSADIFNSYNEYWQNLEIKTVSQAYLNSLSDTVLIKTPDNPNVYILDKGFKRFLASIEIFNSYGLDWDRIVTIDQVETDSYVPAPLIKHGADFYWLDENRVRHYFPSMESLARHGYNTRDAIEANDMEFGSYAEGIQINN